MLITPNIDEEKLNRDFFLSVIQNGIEESIHLDYKSQLGSNAEIAKDLSAFANTDGGNIIYGIKEKDHKPVEITPIDPKGIKEKLDQIATTGIDPSLNVKIWPIDYNEEGQIFAVYIPKKYPFLHYAKKNQRYYKRTNFTSTPMEHYEIEQAFTLRQEAYERLDDALLETERNFVILNGTHNLDVRFILYPLHYGNKLFEIDPEMNNFFRNEIPKTPKYNSSLIWYPEQEEEVPFRQDDYYFASHEGGDLAACLIRTDGIIIYNIHFGIYADWEIEDLLQVYDIFEEPLERTRAGIVFNENLLPLEYIVDYFLGLLGFLHKFYTKLSYFGDIHLTLKVYNINEWIENIHQRSFRHKKLNPINIDFNVELIPKKKMEIVKETFKPIFNGYGLLDEDLRDFYALFED